MQHIELDVAGERVFLLAQRAVFWPRGACVLVADVHLGKAASFRGLGVPVPRGTTDGTLQRLDAALNLARSLGLVSRLVVLGDLIHAPKTLQSSAWESFLVWRKANSSLALQVVQGNHDAKSGLPTGEMGATRLADGQRDGPFAWCHEPRAISGAYVWAGHLHPVVRIQGKARDSSRLACFHLGVSVATLPAFGEFTGGYLLPNQTAQTEGRVFALVPGEQPSIIALPQKRAQ